MTKPYETVCAFARFQPRKYLIPHLAKIYCQSVATAPSARLVDCVSSPGPQRGTSLQLQRCNAQKARIQFSSTSCKSSMNKYPGLNRVSPLIWGGHFQLSIFDSVLTGWLVQLVLFWQHPIIDLFEMSPGFGTFPAGTSCVIYGQYIWWQSSRAHPHRTHNVV